MCIYEGSDQQKWKPKQYNNHKTFGIKINIYKSVLHSEN